MLVIRSAQLRALRRAAWGSFEDEMWAHLQEYFPVDCELMGEAQTRKVIRHGIERADAHGLTTKGQLCRYVDLSLSLGTGFDQDPQLPWAAEILTGGGGDAMDALHARALVHLEQVAGDSGERYRRAMARARRLTFERAADAVRAGPFEAAVRSWLGRLHPEKLATFDDEVLGGLLALGREDAARYGLTSDAATLVHLTLMFMLGGHVARDPQVPWVAEVLGDPVLADPEAKARALADRAMAHLDRAFVLLRAKGG
jgi:hypothetical protein